MKRFLLPLFVLSVFGLSLFLVSCTGDDDDDNNNNTEFIAVQADLDASTNLFEKDITGKPYGDASVAHNGTSMPADSTFRDVYSNWSSKTDPIVKGSIITKHTFMMNPDGSKGKLQVTFAMIKRESGYYADGGDWEYVMMPYDDAVDYNAMSNGMLPTTIDDQMRGKLGMCAGCHASAGSDFLFVR